MSKAMVVAITDFRNAIKLRFVKWGLILAAAFGPIMNIFLVLALVLALPPSEFNMIVGFIGPTVAAMLAIFAIIPTTMISANSLVGEKEQNTLEPLLCTPLTDMEILWGKTMASAIPSLIILVSSTAATIIVTNVILLALGYPMLLIPDLAGLYLLSTATPVMIFAVIAVMIIISGKVKRVYEAYQVSSAVVLVFIIPMIGPMIGMGSGGVAASQVWLMNLITVIIAIALFAVAWAIALKRFDRDRLVSMV
ncbi:MAG: ABC transporter permease subunit [Candidatus Thorarchaeota archaeon]